MWHRYASFAHTKINVKPSANHWKNKAILCLVFKKRWISNISSCHLLDKTIVITQDEELRKYYTLEIFYVESCKYFSNMFSLRKLYFFILQVFSSSSLISVLLHQDFLFLFEFILSYQDSNLFQAAINK